MKPALRLGMSRGDYDRIDAVNWTRLKQMLRSPAHYLHNLTAPDFDSAARKRGRAVHLAVLEPEKFRSGCALWDGGQRRGKAWDAFEAEHQDLEILTEKEHALCLAISKAVRADPDAAAYLSSGAAEVTLEWAATGEQAGAVPGWEFALKSRLDFVSSGIVDLKTTRAASPHGFAAESHRYRYDAQAAFYVDAYQYVTGKLLPYVLIAVEADAPHVVQVYRVPDHILARGRQTYRECLDRLAFCRRENHWSGYLDGESELMLPPWVAQRDDEDVSDLDLVTGGESALEA